MTRALSVPADLAAALECEGLVARFDAFSPSHRNEYLEWIEAAKPPATRSARIAKTIEMIRAKSFA